MPSARRAGTLGAALAIAVGAACLAEPPSAEAAAGARIIAFQILGADGSPAAPPLDRGRRYRYRVRYRIGGAPVLRVGRSLTLVGPDGRPVLRVRPRGAADEPGTFTARGSFALTRRDPTGRYRLRYRLVVRDPASGRAARRQRVIAVRFRDPRRA